MALKLIINIAPRNQNRCARVGGYRYHIEILNPYLDEMVFDVDLGTSSKYSCGNFEGQNGERFHVNNNWIWVRRF